MEDYPESSKLRFPIFESIIYRNLRPNDLTIQMGLFHNPKIPEKIKYPETLEAFETGLMEFFAFKPELLNEVIFFSRKKDFNNIKNKNELFFGEFTSNMEITFPEHYFNQLTELYFFLINNEAIRTFMGLKYAVLKESEQGKKINLLELALLQISMYITNSIERIKNKDQYVCGVYSEETKKQISKNHTYIFTVLLLVLVRLYYEIIYAFKPLIGDKGKSVFELLIWEVESLNNVKLDQVISFGLLRLKAKELLKEEKFNVPGAADVLKELYGQKAFNIDEGKWQETVAALENRLLLREWQGELGMEKFSSSDFADVQLMEIEKKYQLEIEKLKNPKDQLKKVESLILNLKLTFEGMLPEDVLVENSIPQKVRKHLNEKRVLISNGLYPSDNGIEKEGNILSFRSTFFTRNPKKVDKLRISLEDKGFIQKNTPKVDFELIFSEKAITERVRWTRSIRGLKYFIDLIHDNNNFVNKDNYNIVNKIDNQWEVTCHCFLIKKKPETKPDDLRKAHKPNEKTRKILDDIVNSLIKDGVPG